MKSLRLVHSVYASCESSKLRTVTHRNEYTIKSYHTSIKVKLTDINLRLELEFGSISMLDILNVLCHYFIG